MFLTTIFTNRLTHFLFVFVCPCVSVFLTAILPIHAVAVTCSSLVLFRCVANHWAHFFGKGDEESFSQRACLHAVWISYNSTNAILLSTCQGLILLMPYFVNCFSDWQVEPVFIVTISNISASELRPLVRLCPCQNNGSCVDDEDVQRQLDSGERFIVLSCECPARLTGLFCESNFDACVENNDPCFPGVECVNVPPDVNQTGFTCGPCPSGYHGDGATCTGKNDKFPLAQNRVI